MNYTEIYKKIYNALLKDGYNDDYYEYDIIQITRSAASDITYHLWRFLLACENHPGKIMINQVTDVVDDTLQAIQNSMNLKKE